MTERTVRTQADLDGILAQVTFRKSCVNLDWQWESRRIGSPGEGPTGWLVRTSFVRPDTDTGEVARGYGRWEFVADGATESGVVKTCWVLAELIVRHELMEAFEYRGVKIFDPHHTVDELSMPHEAKKRP